MVWTAGDVGHAESGLTWVNMTVQERILETKKNSIYIMCPLVAYISEKNRYRPAVFDIGAGVYAHIDADLDLDLKKQTVKVYVSKLRTPTSTIDKIRAKYTVIAETG